MVKRRVETEVVYCDCCDISGAYYRCSGCERDYCYDCAHIDLTFYPEEVSSSSDSHVSGLRYCPACETKNKSEKPSPLLQACREILRLRNEQKGFWDDFKVRKEAVEARVKKELGRCK